MKADYGLTIALGGDLLTLSDQLGTCLSFLYLMALSHELTVIIDNSY